VPRYAKDDANVFLVGNKTDLSERAVSTEKGEEFANSKGYPFIETSAKTGTPPSLHSLPCTTGVLRPSAIDSAPPPLLIAIIVGDNVEELFVKLSQEMLGRYRAKSEAKAAAQNTLDLSAPAPAKKKKGCSLF
jgi:GTPase SAR1 family protein